MEHLALRLLLLLILVALELIAGLPLRSLLLVSHEASNVTQLKVIVVDIGDDALERLTRLLPRLEGSDTGEGALEDEASVGKRVIGGGGGGGSAGRTGGSHLSGTQCDEEGDGSKEERLHSVV